MFIIGQTYSRRHDIHGKFGGQQQGGISTPRQAPYIFLFTGESGEAYGYRDGWDKNGVFRYTGEGQVGDMTFAAGNQAIRDHAEEGKDLLVFQALGKGKPVRYVGRFACEDWIIEHQPDKAGKDRDAIVFLLKSLDVDAETAESNDKPAPEDGRALDLEALKKRAYAAASPRSSPKAIRAPQTVYQRAQAIKDYVLARAKGICESCLGAAPFERKSGSPYLEPHHTRRVSDGGPDHPRWVGAICPNCHREIHFGKAGAERNTALEAYLGTIEAEAVTGP
jgi:5-methylcytosine-specific restriction protein A